MSEQAKKALAAIQNKKINIADYYRRLNARCVELGLHKSTAQQLAQQGAAGNYPAGFPV